MTALALVFALGTLVGALGGTAVTYRALTRRYDRHGYHQVRLEATSVKAIAEIAEERVHEAVTEAKEWTGDLLDKVADLTGEIEVLAGQLAAPDAPRSPVPTYGARR